MLHLLDPVQNLPGRAGHRDIRVGRPALMREGHRVVRQARQDPHRDVGVMEEEDLVPRAGQLEGRHEPEARRLPRRPIHEDALHQLTEFREGGDGGGAQAEDKALPDLREVFEGVLEGYLGFLRQGLPLDPLGQSRLRLLRQLS